MSSSQSKELKARNKLGKAFVEWIQTKKKVIEENIRSKLTVKEWKQLNELFNQLSEEMIKEANETGNVPLAMRNLLKKIERNPFYEELLNKLEYKMAKEGLQKAKHRKPHYIT